MVAMNRGELSGIIFLSTSLATEIDCLEQVFSSTYRVISADYPPTILACDRISRTHGLAADSAYPIIVLAEGSAANPTNILWSMVYAESFTAFNTSR